MDHNANDGRGDNHDENSNDNYYDGVQDDDNHYDLLCEIADIWRLMLMSLLGCDDEAKAPKKVFKKIKKEVNLKGSESDLNITFAADLCPI